MSHEFSNTNFDFRNGALLGEVQIEETPIVAETINLSGNILGDRIIRATKAIADPHYAHSYRETKISQDGEDYWVVGQNTQFRDEMFAVLGTEDERWVPLNKQAYYAGLVVVNVDWGGLKRLPNYTNDDIIRALHEYADKLRAELAS